MTTTKPVPNRLVQAEPAVPRAPLTGARAEPALSREEVIALGQTKSLAEAGATALHRMQKADHDALVSKLDATPDQIARHAQLAGRVAPANGMQARLLSVHVRSLAQKIREGHLEGAVVSSADRIANLKEALVDGNRKATADALAEIVQKAGATLEQFNALVGRLEILADLAGKGDFRMISDRHLKAKIMELTNGNLKTLAEQVGAELARLAFAPAQKEAIESGLI